MEQRDVKEDKAMGRTIDVLIFYAKSYTLDSYKNQDSQTFEYTEIKDELDTLYNIIGCESIDIVKRKIGNKTYNIVCDDEALFAENPILTAFDPANSYKNIFGTLIVTGIEDRNGNLTSITKEDARQIVSQIRIAASTSSSKNRETISSIILLS